MLTSLRRALELIIAPFLVVGSYIVGYSDGDEDHTARYADLNI
ncbi:MAG TPA: hypothetical protein VGP13_00770 [Candidatus Paceibacterota bacterium]|jgi:hypothetical protein|nr:hypothetical protein [Candidatus Paceibacterota bacterium]